VDAEQFDGIVDVEVMTRAAQPDIFRPGGQT